MDQAAGRVLLRGEQLRREVVGDLVTAQHHPGGEDEAAALEGVVARGEEVRLADMRPGRDVNLLARVMKDLPGAGIQCSQQISPPTRPAVESWTRSPAASPGAQSKRSPNVGTSLR